MRDLQTQSKKVEVHFAPLFNQKTFSYSLLEFIYIEEIGFEFQNFN